MLMAAWIGRLGGCGGFSVNLGRTAQRRKVQEGARNSAFNDATSRIIREAYVLAKQGVNTEEVYLAGKGVYFQYPTGHDETHAIAHTSHGVGEFSTSVKFLKRLPFDCATGRRLAKRVMDAFLRRQRIRIKTASSDERGAAV